MRPGKFTGASSLSETDGVSLLAGSQLTSERPRKSMLSGSFLAVHNFFQEL